MQYNKENYKVCFQQFKKENVRYYMMTILMQILVATSNISIAFLTMITIEALEYSDVHRIIIAGFFLLLMILSFVVFGAGEKHFKNKYLEKGLSNYKMFVFGKILNKSIGEYSDFSSGMVINVFSNDLNSIENNYLKGSIEILYNVFSFAIAVISMAFLNFYLLIAIIMVSLIPIIISCKYGKKIQEKEKTTSNENAGFVDQMKDLLNGFLVIKGFKAEHQVLRIFKKKNITLEEAKRDHRNTNDTLVLASQVANIAVVATVFTVGSIMSFSGMISIGKILAFVQLSNFMLMPISTLVPLYYNRKSAISLINKVNEIIEAKPVTKSKKVLSEFKHSITLENVSIGYNEEKVLHDINLEFEYGKSYIVVGESGCGKSTLLKILMGFFESYEGSIKIDDIELNELSFDSLYNNVSLIQQNVFIFNKSIYDNVTMFQKFDMNNYDRAISLSGLSSLIEKKKGNYLCGDNGSNLSGGERQRISIARSLLRETPIILLDEATVALDNFMATEIENAVLKLKDIIRIVVSHKLNHSILSQYDEIVVMKGGRIIEKGKFDDLISRKGYFYALYNVS